MIKRITEKDRKKFFERAKRHIKQGWSIFIDCKNNNECSAIVRKWSIGDREKYIKELYEELLGDKT